MSNGSLRRPLRAVALALLLGALPAVAQTLPRAEPAEVGMSAERLARLTTTLDGYVADGRLPGAVVLVARDGRVVHHAAVGYRDREARDPMRADALFRIASQTKAIVSVGVLMLQEDGALLLSDQVARHLPAFARVQVAEGREGGGYDVVAARRAPTIRDLLTHTAGVGYGGGPADSVWAAAGIQGWYFAHREEPIGATVDRIATLPFQAHPGEAWVYGYSTDILGALIEQVSGLTLDAFLRARILEPLGMRDTRFYVEPGQRDRLATVYNLPPGGPLARAPDGPGMQSQGEYVEGPRRSFSGGAGLVSTAEDYARFLQMLANGGAFDGVRILSPPSVHLMTSDHLGELYRAPGMGFGLGFWVREDPAASGLPGSVGEYGWGGAYHSTYWVDPVERLIVVYLTQVIPAAGLDDHARVRALVYGSIERSAAGR